MNLLRFQFKFQFSMIIKIMEQKWNLLSSEHFRIESDLVGIEKYAKMISENINDFCRVAIRFFPASTVAT